MDRGSELCPAVVATGDEENMTRPGEMSDGVSGVERGIVESGFAARRTCRKVSSGSGGGGGVAGGDGK